MSTLRMMGLVSVLSLVWITSTGCVSRDEYLREKFARRKAVERSETLERDLADERNRVLALESASESMRRELDTKSALADTLKRENERLDQFVAKLQGDIDEMMKRGIGEVKVVKVQLPPELDRALKEFAAQYPGAVEYDADRGAVRWKSDLTFDKGSDLVRSDALPSLKKFSEIVNSEAAKPFEIVVVGHTDNLRIGPVTAKNHPSNWHLSVHRSIAVMGTLNRYGVGFGRLGVMGYGEYQPRVPNPPTGGAEANRRVEIFLVSPHEPGPTQQEFADMNSTTKTETTKKTTKSPKTSTVLSEQTND